jgi:hypothetical protein
MSRSESGGYENYCCTPRITFIPGRWKRQFPTKHRYLTTNMSSAKLKKTIIWRINLYQTVAKIKVKNAYAPNLHALLTTAISRNEQSPLCSDICNTGTH